MGLFKRTKEIGTQKIMSIEDMKTQLKTNRETIQTELARVKSVRQKNEKDVQEWENRVQKASRYIKATTNPDALEALEILKAQAESFLEEAKMSKQDDSDYVLSLEENKAKITAALDNLESMEKKEALNKHLQNVAEGLNSKSLERKLDGPVIQDDKLNEIRRLIHTTEALVEIRSSSTKLKISS